MARVTADDVCAGLPGTSAANGQQECPLALDLEKALLACAEGDKRALNAIYEAEGARMLGVAMRILNRRSLAEKAVQDAFVLVWRKAASFDPAKGAAATWLYTVLRNRSLTILRDEGRAEPTDMPPDEEVAGDGESPEDTIARLSDAEALKHCLQKLEPKRRMAIALTYVHGLSHGELAGKLGLPLGTIKSWLRRSLLTLRECLQ
jgi:RNA polymerase sigma factor (sigma-70 family)